MTIENTDNTKPTSQSSAAASTSSADIKISQDLKSTLELGQVYRAITAVKTSSTGEVTKGVVVKDQFVEMEYPSTIAPGSQVTVRVDATEPSLKLTIIETKPIEHAEGSVSSNAKLIRDLLSRALKANNVGLSNELAEILSNKIHTLESGSTIITSEVLESGAATLEKSLKLSSKDKSFTTVKLLKNLVDEVVQQQELLDQTVKLFLESPKELSRQLSELRPELPAASAESDVRDSFEPKANAQLSRIVDSLGRQYEAISDGKTLEETSKSIRNLLTTVYESDSRLG